MTNYILGIETSCDETSIAIVENGRCIHSNLISSQVELHSRYGGVVPEIASRRHLEVINPLVDDALKEAGLTPSDLTALAVSHGPGLVGALLVGVNTAKALAYVWERPLIPVHHLIGHLYANYLNCDTIKHPYVSLITSGGHTDLLYSPSEATFHVLGGTRDDAAGEAFDKIARKLNLGYPGGPVIEAAAQRGNPYAVNLPRAYLGKEGRYDFSFSGLKTAVINYLHQKEQKGWSIPVADLAASFQQAVIDMLLNKTMEAVKEKRPASLLLSGGVAANASLRKQMKSKLYEETPEVSFFCPPPELCTDNAAMIAAAAYPLYLRNNFASLDLNAHPNLEIPLF